MNSILRFISSLFSERNFTLKNFAFFLLVIFSTQYIPLEGRTISLIKVAIMAIASVVLFTHLRISKALGIIFIYIFYIWFTAYFLHSETFRASTVIYLFLFLLTYVTFYNLVWKQEVLEIDEFIVFLKRFIYVLSIVLILQQIVHFFGIQYFPILNMYIDLSDRGLSGNSFSLEPSIFARTMGVLYYAYLKCNEYKQDHEVTIFQILRGEHKTVTLFFLWSMFTMGSGTAFICLGILSLYFLRGAYMLFAIPIFVGVFYTLSYFEVRQFQRASVAVEATMTGDVDEVREADGSASARIEPVLNTIHYLDLNDVDAWFGHGVDYGKEHRFDKGKRMIGGISDYGFIAYILTLVLVFSCVMKFRSLGTIMFFCGVGGTVTNVAYCWGLLMIFTCVRYFHTQMRLGLLELDDDTDNEEENEENEDEN